MPRPSSELLSLVVTLTLWALPWLDAAEAGAAIGPFEAGAGTLEISFERGASLRFAATQDGTYTLAGRKKRRSFFDRSKKPPRVEVDFDDATWKVVAGADSYLMIERDALGKLAKSRRVLPGLRTEDAR